MIIVLLLLLMIVVPAYAEYGVIPQSDIDPDVIRIDEEEYLGKSIDLDNAFIDEDGKEFTLREMTGKPLIILFSYYSCNGLCPTSVTKLNNVLSEIKRFRTGKDYRVLTLSFDKNDDLQSLNMFVHMTGFHEREMDGWKMAIMKDKGNIDAITKSVGYKFFWSPRDKVFLHPNTFIFLSPNGRVVRYIYGTTINSKDLELALTEAGFEMSRRSGMIDLLNMACYSYNFKEGRYTLNYPVFIGLGSLFLGISSIVVPLVIKKRKGAKL